LFKNNSEWSSLHPIFLPDQHLATRVAAQLRIRVAACYAGNKLRGTHNLCAVFV
jgi:hypothetical protein